LLPFQLAASVASGATVAVVAGASAALATGVLVAWVVGARSARDEALSPWVPELVVLVDTVTLTMAGLAVAVAATGWGEDQLRDGALVALTATAVFLLVSLASRRLASALRVLLVGDDRSVRGTAVAWADRSDVVLTGAVVLVEGPTLEPEPGGTDAGLATPVSHDPSAVARLVQEWDVDVVVVLPSAAVGADLVQQLCWQLEDTPARLAVRTGLDAMARHRVHLTHLSGTSVARVEPSCPSPGVRRVKRAMDRVLAGLLLVVLAPLLALLLLLVRLDSPGSPVFRQQRVGHRGALFTMYKLRTMVDHAEELRPQLAAVDEGNGVLFKMREDPRVTRLGRFLRKTSLDELPQLVNVLRGEMSLVGPRPALPEEVAAYDERARRRLAVLPGMTGLWQVRGRSTLGWEESVALDLHYADNITIGRDLAICVQTLRAVVHGRGAY